MTVLDWVLLAVWPVEVAFLLWQARRGWPSWSADWKQGTDAKLEARRLRARAAKLDRYTAVAKAYTAAISETHLTGDVLVAEIVERTKEPVEVVFEALDWLNERVNRP